MYETMQTRDVAKKLGVSYGIAGDLMNRPDFPSVLVGNKFVITSENFATWVRSCAGQEYIYRRVLLGRPVNAKLLKGEYAYGAI